MGRACVCQAQWQVWGWGWGGGHMPCENPSSSTESQPVTSHTPVVGQQGWNCLGVREETQLSQPGRVLGRAPRPHSPGRWGIRRLYLHGIQGRLWQERKAQRRVRTLTGAGGGGDYPEREGGRGPNRQGSVSSLNQVLSGRIFQGQRWRGSPQRPEHLGTLPASAHPHPHPGSPLQHSPNRPSLPPS